MGVIAQEEIRYEGLFDRDGLFDKMRDFFIRRGFIVHEKEISHSTGSSGDDEEYKWEIEQEPSPYISYHIKLTLKMENSRKVEVLINGKKQKLQYAKLKLSITSSMTTDRTGKFKGKFLGTLRKWFEENIYDAEIGDYEDALFNLTVNFYDEIKKYLKLHSA